MNKYKKLALNTVVFAIGVFGSKILVILLTRLYAHNIDDVNSGVKDLLETTLLLIQPVFTFALQEYLIRFGLDKAYDKREVFTTSSMITLGGMALMAVCVPIMRGLPALNFLKGYTLLFIAYTAMSSLRMLCQNFVRSRDMVKLFSLDGILTTLTFFLFNIMFISKMHMGVKGFLLAVILSDSCSVVFLFVAAKLRGFMNREYFNPDLAREMMRFAGPLIPTIVMWAITSLSDRLFLLRRAGKLGLGTAYITGFKWALQHDYQYVFEMDADFSHDPKDLPRLYAACHDEGFDLAVGSRYVSGVNVVNWPMGRVLMSYFASCYVRFVTGFKVHDTTAGFVCYRRRVLETIDLDKIRFKGYAFQIEMKFTAYKIGFRIKEVPVVFVNRREGTSKMSGGIFSEAFFGVMRLRLDGWLRKYPKLPKA